MKKLQILCSAFCILLCAIAFCAVLTPFSADAATTSDGFEYDITNGEVTIFNYTGSATELTIPAFIKGYPVTCIDDETFYFCDDLISIVIPEGVTTIGSKAIYYCGNLQSITIPASVDYMGDEAISSCHKLNGIWVDENNAHYSSDSAGALFNKTQTTLIRVPGGISSEYTIPDSVTEIGDYAFSDCSYLTDVSMGKNVAYIGYGAFYSCYELTNITLPKSLEYIGNHAFVFCSKLTSIDIPDGVTYVGDSAFSYCDGLINVTLPNSVDYIGTSVFYSSEQVHYNTYNNGKYLGSSTNPYLYLASSTSDYISSIQIHNNTKLIAENAFSYCDSLTEITIPASVSSIGAFAFSGCDSLTAIWVSEDNPVYSNDENGILFNKNKTTIIQAPAMISGTYVIPNSVTHIGSSAFGGCRQLTGVSIPDSVIRIDDMAFSGCDNLPFSTYDNGLYVGNSENPYYALVDIDDDWEEYYGIHPNTKIIGAAACKFSEIYRIVIPDSVAYIGANAFNGCENLTRVTIGNGVISIGESAFTDSYQLREVIIGSNVAVIESHAFFSCHRLENITIPNSVTTIGNYAFTYCKELSDVTIGSGITSIGEGAFAYCDNLSQITFNGNAPKIDSSAFSNTITTARYPADNETWTDDVLQNYGGTITWLSYGGLVAGDLDGEEGVDNRDVEYLLWYTLFPDDYPLPQNADLDGDGSTDNKDVEYLLWHTLFPEDYPL